MSRERRDTRRRFEQWARNPRCEANTISAVFGIEMAKVAEAEGQKRTMGQSPFAIQRGLTFERVLFANGAAVLFEALHEAGVVPKDASGLRDLRLRKFKGESPDLDHANRATTELLRHLGSIRSNPRPAGVPWMVAGGAVLVPGAGILPEALLVLDVLVIRPSESSSRDGWELVVGEIKTYPDRGGYTDGAELAVARAQAGVYVHGLRVVLNELGIGGRVAVSPHGFLVLTRPGSNRPRVRAGENLLHQAERAERGFGLLRRAAGKYRYPIPEEQQAAAVSGAATDYCQACVGFCDRAPVCFRRALQQADPSVLGDDVKRYLGGVSLDRAMELIAGGVARSEGEQDLKARLAAALGGARKRA